MDKDMIEALKNNEKPFGLMSEEMQAVARKLGQGEMEYYDDKGSWDGVCETTLWYSGDAYRLRPDYRPAPALIECEVSPNEAGTSRYFRYDNWQTVDDEFCSESFIGYGAGDKVFGRLYKHKEQSSVVSWVHKNQLDKYDVLPIDAVLFSESK